MLNPPRKKGRPKAKSLSCKHSRHMATKARGMRDAEELVAGVSALFAGGELSENDKDAVMRALQDAYWMAKERNIAKYTPKKYRKEE